MQHFHAAGFSEEVSRLAAAIRSTSTNHINDRWLHLARWAAGQGTDPLRPTATQIALFETHGPSPQMVKGLLLYRSL